MRKQLRHLSLSILLAAPLGCAGSVANDVGEDADAVTDVTHSVVKRQSIGNCWLYAQASWLESLNKSATGTEMNASESYWSYWHWFDQVVNGEVSTEIETGGGWSTASDIIRMYGVMKEGDFVKAESESEMSGRQASALAALNTSLKSGVLSDADVRSDKLKVREEFDKAWNLDDDVRAQLDKVFGASVTRNLTTKNRNTGEETAKTEGTGIMRARDVAAQFTTAPGKPEKLTVEDALATWEEAYYRRDAQGRRDFLKRVQRALHDSQPVLMSWFVDFNSLDSEGRFFAPPATPGHQGGHMVALEDYQVNNVPGYGTLKAGTLETREEALEAALDDDAEIEFIRVKNSWGSSRSDRQFVIPGYHDLYMKYLNGPVKQCPEKNTGGVENCWDKVPLQDVVLPPGY